MIRSIESRNPPDETKLYRTGARLSVSQTDRHRCREYREYSASVNDRSSNKYALQTNGMCPTISLFIIII